MTGALGLLSTTVAAAMATSASAKMGGDAPTRPMPEPLHLSDVWKQTRRRVLEGSEPLSTHQLTALRELARALFVVAVGDATSVVPELDWQARRFGLEARVLRLPRGERAVGLLDQQAGRGGCVVRVGAVKAEVLLQAPHRFFDRGTGTIARAVFEGASLRGLCFATAHRYAHTGGKPTCEPCPSDLAHEPKSHFTAMTLGAAAAIPSILVVQLHGYGNSKATRGVDAIVSPGASKAVAQTRQAARVLEALGGRTRIFPEQIKTLGGTSNAQGKALAAAGLPFLHVELSAAFRQRLTDAPRAAKLGTALAETFAVSARDARPREDGR